MQSNRQEKVLSRLHQAYKEAESSLGKKEPEKKPSPEPPLPPDHPQPPAPIKEPPEPSEPPIQAHMVWATDVIEIP